MGEITNFNRNLGTKQVCFEVHVQVWSGGMLLYSPTHIGKTTSANMMNVHNMCKKVWKQLPEPLNLKLFLHILCPQDWCVSEILIPIRFWHPKKFLICIIKFWYVSKKKISEISDIYQKKLICIRNFWYVSEISDMYHKILICIIKFWYVSEISDTYFFKMHQKFLISFKNKQQMHIVRHTFKKITWAAGSRQP